MAAPAIWLFYRDRSERVALQALQSLRHQVSRLIALAAGWTLTGVLMTMLIGFLLVPFMALLTLIPFVHSANAAYRVARGEDYRYPVIAGMVDGRQSVL